jgi:hypothetical protein
MDAIQQLPGKQSVFILAAHGILSKIPPNELHCDTLPTIEQVVPFKQQVPTGQSIPTLSAHGRNEGSPNTPRHSD